MALLPFALRTVAARDLQIRSRRSCPTRYPLVLCVAFLSLHNAKLKPGGSLLSHGETPHYHRRYGVSLLSSAWGQVGPPRYRRQANSFHSGCRFPFGHNTQNQSLNKLNETLSVFRPLSYDAKTPSVL